MLGKSGCGSQGCWTVLKNVFRNKEEEEEEVKEIM